MRFKRRSLIKQLLLFRTNLVPNCLRWIRIDSVEMRRVRLAAFELAIIIAVQLQGTFRCGPTR